MDAERVRFDAFELDLKTCDLKKDGGTVKLPRQPSQLLALLARNAGSIVTREDIQKALWSDGTVVDYDQSINFCVKRIREALGDDPATPRYLETVPRKGYRFLGDVHPAIDGEPRPRVPMWAFAFAIAVAGGVLLYFGSRRTSSPSTPVHLSVALEPGQMLSTSNPLAISPDGNTIVANTAGRLYLRRIDEHELRAIPGSEDAQNPFFAPDGERIGFLQKGFIRTLSLAGGASAPICPVENYIHGRWGDRDTIFFSTSTKGPIFAVSAQGGTPEPVTTLDSERAETGHAWPEPLPGERALLYSVFREAAPPQVALKDLIKGSVRIVVEDGFHPLVASTGHVVFSRKNSLFAVAFDAGRLDTFGRPEPVLDDVYSDLEAGVSAYDLARNGTLLYEPSTTSPLLTTELVWVDRTGRAELVTDERGSIGFPRLSPDERRLLVTVATTRASYGDLHIIDLATRSMSRFRPDGDSYSGNWSPDGQQIVFTSKRSGGSQNLYLAPANGTGDVERITTHTTWEFVNSWSPSGAMAMVRADVSTRRDIYLLSLGESREPVPLLTSPFFERAPTLSPDGRLLAYESNESGEHEVYVAAVPRMADRVKISRRGGITPLWSKDGQELFYVENDKMMVVEVTTETTLTHSSPRVLFQGHYVPGVHTGAHWANYDVTADGKRFVMVRQAEAAGTPRFDLILNWHETLKRIGDGR